METVTLKLTVRRAPDAGFCIEDEGGDLVAARTTLLEASQWITDKLFETFREAQEASAPPTIPDNVVMPSIVRQQQETAERTAGGLIERVQRRVGARQ